MAIIEGLNMRRESTAAAAERECVSLHEHELETR